MAIFAFWWIDRKASGEEEKKRMQRRVNIRIKIGRLKRKIAEFFWKGNR